MKLCQEKEKAVVLVTKILTDSLWSDKKVHFHLRQEKEVILNKTEELKKKKQKNNNSKCIFIRWDSINWNKKSTPL